MSYRIDFAETFYESLDEELEYVDSYSPDKRKQLIESLRSKLDAIEAMPFAYPECRELPTPQKQYRSATHLKRYRIIYKVETNLITFLLFFNTKQDPGRLKLLV